MSGICARMRSFTFCLLMFLFFSAVFPFNLCICDCWVLYTHVRVQNLILIRSLFNIYRVHDQINGANMSISFVCMCDHIVFILGMRICFYLLLLPCRRLFVFILILCKCHTYLQCYCYCCCHCCSNVFHQLFNI